MSKEYVRWALERFRNCCLLQAAQRIKRSAFVCVTSCLCISFCTSAPVSGHIPHDEVEDIALSPNFSEDHTVFAVIRQVLYRSIDGGYTWTRLSRGLCVDAKRLVAVSPEYEADRTVFVSCGDGAVYRSTNAGDSWSKVWSSKGKELIKLLSCRTGELTNLYAVYSSGYAHNIEFAAGETVELSGDGRIRVGVCTDSGLILGTSEGKVLLSSGTAASMVQLAAVDSPVSSIHYLGGDPANLQAIVGTDAGGVRLVSATEIIDMGVLDAVVTGLTAIQRGSDLEVFAVTWNEGVYLRANGGWSLRSDGLRKNVQAADMRAPNFSDVLAADDGTIIAATFCGPYKSADGALSWQALEPSRNHIIGLDAAINPSGGNTLVLGTYGGGAYVSTEDGVSWRVANTGITNPRLGAVKLSPDFATDSTVFAAHYNYVLRSTRAGQSWERIPINDFPISFVGRLLRRIARELSRLPAGRRFLDWIDYSGSPPYRFPEDFAISKSFSSDSTIFVGLYPYGVVRSIDQGRSFKLLWETNRSRVWSVALSPDYSRDKTVFIALKDGVYRSADSGDTWKSVGDASIGRSVLAISPDFQTDGTLFAGGPSGLYRSSDSGASWTRVLKDRPSRQISAVVISPDYARDRRVLVQEEGGDFLVLEDEAGREMRVTETSVMDFSQLIGGKETAPLIVPLVSEGGNRTIIYAASGSDLVRSLDGGASWTVIARPVRQEVELVFRNYYVSSTRLSGSWTEETDMRHSNGAVLHSSELGSKLRFDFVGNSFGLVGTIGPDRGVARVYIDNQLYGRVDQYAEAIRGQVTIFAIDDLEPGPHRVEIEVTGDANPRSAGIRVDLDAFDVPASNGNLDN